MSNYPPSIQQFIDQFRQFPGIGSRSAEKFAFYLLKQTTERAKQLSQSILELKSKIQVCSICFHIGENDICNICNDPKRDTTLICVVEHFKDVLSIERTQEYQGVYHVLMGHLSPMDGINPDNLTISELFQRIDKAKLQNPPIKEVILACNPTLAGDATSLYLLEKLKLYSIKLTRIARGLAIGTEIEFADPATLSKSLLRREVLDLD